MRWSASDSAMGQAVTFMVAGVVFVASLGGVLMISQQTVIASDTAERLATVSQSDALLQAVLAGGVQDDDGEWQRFGLLDEQGGLSREALDALCGAGIKPADDTRMQYDELMASLGLEADDGLQFHLSIAPADAVDIDMDEYRIAYVEAMPAEADYTRPDVGDPLSWTEVPFVYDAMVASTVLEERQAIGALGAQFDDRPNMESDDLQPTMDVLGVPTPAKGLFPDADLGGDVYIADSDILEGTLADDLADYDILFVGSGVPPHALSPLETAAKQWVLDGGIILIMGGSDAEAHWLDELFAGGEPSDAPLADLSYGKHPVFRLPFSISPQHYVNELAPTVYEENLMEHVLLAGSQGLERSHLALSRCGAFGDGFVARSSYDSAIQLDGENDGVSVLKLYDFAVDPPRVGTDFEHGVNEGWLQAEASAQSPYPLHYFLANLVHYAILQGLHLELGPVPPDGSVVVSSQRMSWIDDPLYGAIPMQVQVTAWEA